VSKNLLVVLLLLGGCASPGLTINQLQFVGSHNSYKKAMSPEYFKAVFAQNADAARALEYSHVPIQVQLDLGLRQLELDIFYEPTTQLFAVGHVQLIDMNSHCATLSQCLEQVKAWSDDHPRHVPLWITLNAKDQAIAGLPKPIAFDEAGLKLLDDVVETVLGDRLIRPSAVKLESELRWPRLAQARGKILLILDEVADKRDLYWEGWLDRPLFTNAPIDHEAAAIMIVNDPIAQRGRIEALVDAGYMVRTRADADTHEARNNSTLRRDAALSSGAQAISTDYYLPSSAFDSDYQVKLPRPVRCNPRLTNTMCWITE